MKTIQKCQLFILFLAIAFAGPAFGGTDWKVSFKVSGTTTFGTCAAGVNTDATDVQDFAYDVRAMLESLNATNAYCYFPHPEWNDVATENFREDIQALGIEKQWTMEVLSNVVGELTLEWPDLQQRLVGYRAYLTDIGGTGQVVDMQEVSSVAFDNIVDTARRFTITVIAPDIPPSDTLWAEAKQLKVRLGWEQSDNPAVAGYNLFRKLPDQAYEKVNKGLIDPNRGFYLDNIHKRMVNSQESMIVLYKLETIVVDPVGTVLNVSNEVEVAVEARQKKMRR